MSDQKPWYLEQSEALGSAYLHFRHAIHEKSVLDRKTRELLMLALACAFRCPHCTEDHIQGALDAGASKQEVAETLLLTAYEGAGTQLAWRKELYEQYLGALKQK
jgi:AhpD family alkylhydroperoxidase